MEAQWQIGYGVGLRIKRSSVRIRLWPLRWVLGQGSLLPLSQGEAFTLASISYLAILVKYILARKKTDSQKKKKAEKEKPIDKDLADSTGLMEKLRKRRSTEGVRKPDVYDSLRGFAFFKHAFAMRTL